MIRWLAFWHIAPMDKINQYDDDNLDAATYINSIFFCIWNTLRAKWRRFLLHIRYLRHEYV